MKAGGSCLTWVDKKCPICGKVFTVFDVNTWAYKRRFKNAGGYYCSWGCLRAAERENDRLLNRGDKK